MPKYEIHDFENNSVNERNADNILDLMFDYLPWPRLDVNVEWNPHKDKNSYVVIDNITDFMFHVRVI